MIGIVVVTHGHLAEEMLRTLSGVLGTVPQIAGVACPEDADRFRSEIRAALEQVNDGDGVLILTDMLGDTATNLSLILSHEVPAEVVAGVNMPMLIKAVTSRDAMGLRELASFIRDYGRSHILWATEPEPPTTGVRR